MTRGAPGPPPAPVPGVAARIAAGAGAAAAVNLFVVRNREIDSYLWLLPLSDLLGTLLWGLSFCSRTVWWKERRFRVLKGGAMAEIH